MTKFMSDDADDEVATDIPKYADKDARTEYRLQQAYCHADWGISCNAGIFRDPIFSVLILADGKWKFSEQVIGEPTINQMLCQPCTPSSLRRHLRPDTKNRNKNACTGKRQEKQCLGSQDGAVTTPKSVKKIAPPIVQAILDQQLQQHAC